MLAALPILALENNASWRCGDIRNALERAGTSIGPHDMLIAAHALSLGFTLVTDNAREFGRVKGLKLQNWLSSAKRP